MARKKAVRISNMTYVEMFANLVKVSHDEAMAALTDSSKLETSRNVQGALRTHVSAGNMMIMRAAKFGAKPKPVQIENSK